jgi:hypothetical protein
VASKKFGGYSLVVHRSRLNGGSAKRFKSRLDTSKANYWYPTPARITWGDLCVNENQYFFEQRNKIGKWVKWFVKRTAGLKTADA